MYLHADDVLVSVDVEASGPIPGEYSMLSLGACIVGREHQRFYVEIAPTTRAYQPEALAVAGFDLDDLAARGTTPAEAMSRFATWIAGHVPQGRRPIFVAYPLAFDWMFVAYYFHRFLGRNPFGYAGLDVGSFHLGLTRSGQQGGRRAREGRLDAGLVLTHNALEDAIAQSKLVTQLLERGVRG